MSSAVADDRYRAMEMILPLCSRPEVRCVVVDGEPPSKARARFTSKGKPYTPRVTVEGEKRIAARLYDLPTYRGNVVLGCVFYRSSRQRVDLDNLLKAVLDAGTRAHMWEDDCQVTAIMAELEYDREAPRTILAFGPHASSLTRGDDARVICEGCGKLYFPAGNQRRENSRWCSRACQTYLAEPVPCGWCKQPFKRLSGNQRFCSPPCRESSRVSLMKAKTHCPNNHEYTPENTRIMLNGRRRCRRCSADAQQAVRDRRTQSAQLELVATKEYGEPGRVEVKVSRL